MPKLVFHSKSPNYAPENISNIISALQETGFIGEKWQCPNSISGERYLIGESFLSLVTFMGCAPAIELEPIEDNLESTDFCHIEIEEIQKDVKFVRGSEHVISRCPHCRQRHADWKNISDNLSHTCDKCKVETPLAQYDWKNTAGVGRFFISLHGIYPQEALPTSSLFKTLEKISNTEWTYFYIQ